MAYVVVRRAEPGEEFEVGVALKPVSRAFAKRSAAESRRHVLAQNHPDWQLDVRLESALPAPLGARGLDKASR